MHHRSMSDFSCWFCDRAIERSDAEAVLIQVRSFWRWYDGSSEDGPAQAVYAHSACARDALKGAKMTLETSIFGKDG
jgi:hypothetical protein